MFLTGCGNRETLLKEITDFNKSVQTGTEAITVYYSSVNDQELQLYSLILELSPNCEVGDKINYNCLDPNFHPSGNQKDFFDSPLKQPPFPVESIQVRVSLLKELADYSQQLASLAGDSSAAKFQGNITTLQTRLSELEKKFQELQDRKSNLPDSTISKRYIGPLSTIIGILRKIAIQEAQWKKIRKSIIEAEEPVNTVLTSVADDLDTYALPLKILDADAQYSLLINYYNQNRSHFAQQERAAIISKIVTYKTSFDLAAINKPSKLPNDLKNAHKSLVKLAKSDGSIKDIAELRAWLENFKDDATQLKEAIIQLAQIKEANKNDQTRN